MQTIGEQIRAARKAKKMTQDQLAEILNMSRQGISHWEQGRTSPDAEMLLRLSQVLEYSFEAHHEVELPVQPPVQTHTTVTDEPAVSPARTAPQILPAPQPAEPAPVPEAAPQCVPEPDPAVDGINSAPAGDLPVEPAIAAQPVRSRRKKSRIIAAAIAAALLLGLGVLLWLPSASPDVSIAFLEDEINLMFYPAYFDGYGYGWIFTLSIHNETDVPLRPDRVTTLFYSDERILAKLHQTYEELLEYMDSDLLYREDTPLHLHQATNQLSADRVECILYATDPEGQQKTYSVSAPLLRPDHN